MYVAHVKEWLFCEERAEKNLQARMEAVRELALEAASHHSVLGVSRSATLQEIRHAYRRAALKWHPDKVQGDKGKAEAQAMFLRLAIAYETLSDASRRAEYERFNEYAGLEGSQQGPQSTTSAWSGPMRAAPRDEVHTHDEPVVDAWQVFERAFEGVDRATIFEGLLESVARSRDSSSSSPSTVDEACGAVAATLARKGEAANAEVANALRSHAEHAALVAELQDEYFADDVLPPTVAICWTPTVLRRFFETGGSLPEPERERRGSEVQRGSSGGPPDQRLMESAAVRPMPKLNGGPSLRHAIEAADERMLESVAITLGRAGFVRCRFGAASSTFRAAAQEAAAAHVRHALLSCSSPSGAHRDDTCVLVRDASRLAGGASSWPALHALSQSLSEALHGLCGFLAAELGLVVTSRSDAVLGRFGPGACGYGAHLDSCYDRGADSRVVSALLYLNEGWRDEDGGALRVWDDSHACWQEAWPRADELVLLRSDRTLHKVMPIGECAPSMGRFALTMFLCGRYA